MSILCALYETLSGLHRAYHERLIGRVVLPGCPTTKTLSVGNFTWGGTGKTPFCAWLAERKGKDQTAILSRGYLGGDEADLLARRGFIVGKNKDRVKAAEQVLPNEQGKTIRYWVLDDGLQHWRVKRDMDFVMVDCLRPFGTTGKLIPMGSLRERPEVALRRASTVILHNASLVDEEVREELRKFVKQITAVPVVFSEAAPSSSTMDALKARSNSSWILFSGLGNNDAFFRMMHGLAKEMNSTIIKQVEFTDHYKFTPKEIAERVPIPSTPDDKHPLICYLTTEKDMARCPWVVPEPFNAMAVEVGWKLLGGDCDEFLNLVDSV